MAEETSKDLQRWTAVDAYLQTKLIPRDEALESALRKSNEAELPQIQVTAHQAKLLMLLASIQGARKILEIGTLGGYSTIWLARALPNDGQLISLELEPKHAAVARENIERAGLSDRVQIRVGMASDLLPALQAEGHDSFDFIFIDADKPSTPIYWQWALELSRSGTVIVVDNVIRDGAVIEDHSTDDKVQGVRTFIDMASQEPRVTVTAIQTVGEKGYDGFAIARVN